MAICGELVASNLGGTDLKYMVHMTCVRKAIAGTRKEREQEKMDILGHMKEEVG